ncbi:MAG: group III truncated hemoglobin [Bacteroidota bacterium]
MASVKDIKDLEDIKLLVNSFYGKVREDELLGPIFESVVQGNWEPHLNKMYSFWQTVLTEDMTYRGRPFPPHMKLPVEQKHFERWLGLFSETVDANFAGVKAEEAKWRAQRMATMFWSKISYFRSRSSEPLF